MIFKLPTFIGSDDQRTTKSGNPSNDKVRQLVSLEMLFVGTTLGQRMKRSMIVIQYWYPSDDGSGPMKSMWIWENLASSSKNVEIRILCVDVLLNVDIAHKLSQNSV
ncbi:hypothetical protein CDAR_555151 [Caerostris darwini]|uniref:Uncharacterized protein n=1 Tax=Caerostris darwini TaxID=1538125 RepID=A0AAV4RFC2_9ARAC|nr:hypothetical protein CDAR_555151 [Caerostris darwini]